MKKLTPKELEAHKARLEGLLAVVTGDMDRLHEEALGDGGVQPQLEPDGGSASYSQEFSLELLQRDGSTVREILAALERINQGIYGACEACGLGIVKERLRMVPHARNCIECQRKEEQGLL